MIKGKIAPRLIFNVASIYTEVIRIIMEYIDNSIDAATKLFFSLFGSTATIKDLNIQIEITGRFFSEGVIRITDNCRGIKDLKKVVERIGNSDKRDNFITNGQFGYGIYAFMAMCNKLEIITKHEDNHYSESIVIRKSDFLVDDIEDLNFNITRSSKTTKGTEIILSDFNKDKWEEIDEMQLKKEIENHFELILSEESVKIEIKDRKGNKYLCVPPDYTAKGFHKEWDLDVDVFKESSLSKAESSKIKVVLNYVPNESISRPPVIIINNRRIVELYQIKAFRSYNKREIWHNISMQGYVNCYKLAKPTIARNDVKTEKGFSKILKAVIDIEEEILKWMADNIEARSSRDFSDIESMFNSKLNSIKKEADNIKLSDKDTIINSEEGDTKDVMVIDPKGPDEATFLIREGKTLTSKGGDSEQDGKKVEKVLKASKSKERVSYLHNELKLKIDDTSELIKTDGGGFKRSELFGTEVVIFKKHDDFIKRIKTISFIDCMTPELINYISCELLTHYTNYYFQSMAGEKNVSIKEALQFFAEHFYKFENSLSGLIGKPLCK